ncbi:NACHT, LRR and PYD domains-containing protein 3-like [Aplochiton taeniatus]
MNQTGEEEEPVKLSNRIAFWEAKRKTQSSRQQDRPVSPVPSCVSMKSDQSMVKPANFSNRDFTTESCDRSMVKPANFSNRDFTTEPEKRQQRSEVPGGPFVQGHSHDHASIFKLLEEYVVIFVKNELKRFEKTLFPDHPGCTESHMEDVELMDAGEAEQRSSAREGALKIALHFLRNMKQQELADTLEHSPADIFALTCQRLLKTNLKKKYEFAFEGVTKEGGSTLLNQIYTDVYLTEGGSGEVNTKHEVRQIETLCKKPVRPGTPIRVNDIFEAPPGQDKPIRTVLTKGVAGIGKTFATQKFTLDWAEGLANQKIQFTFPILFRELHLLERKTYSLMELLHQFFIETRNVTNFSKYQVIFVLDGLDECRLPLDFQNNEIWTDVTEPTSVDVLLTNLIKGNLLPSARLWITTRPAAANQIPPEYVDLETEVRGFADPQKEEYFIKKFSKKKLASRIISHIKTSRSLHIMCHIPVFCLITSRVLEHMLTDQSGELPKTLTEMYIHFLVFQTKQGKSKYQGRAETDPHWNTESRKIVLSLGKLAFRQLERGNLIFYESDLTECGIDVRAASVCSGVFTQIFREERGLYQTKMFCFVHLSVQEFLAAVYVILLFTNNHENVMEEPPSTSNPPLHSVHRVAVDKALQSENGHWDLFLRFLLGLSLETNQRLLRGLLAETGSSSKDNEQTVEYIKKLMEEKDLSPERGINLIHCLNELGDTSLVKEVQGFLTRGGFQLEDLSPAQCSALVFVLVTTEEELGVFDLKRYSRSEAGLLKLLPVLEAKAPRGLLLSGCSLTEESCASLASALRSNTFHLKELDLSNNIPGDSTMKLFSILLEDPNCRVETLRLSGCSFKEEGCSSLASALRSNPSHLRELDMSYNYPGDFGVKLLSALLEDPQSRLATLRMSGCSLTEKRCASLVSAVQSNPSHMRALDLSFNQLADTGMKTLSALLEDPLCRLETLGLSGCWLTVEGCASLASALKSNPSHLRELDLSYNFQGDSGVKLLSTLLQDPLCKLEALRLCKCDMSAQCCEELALALTSSDLRVLDLSNNNLQDSGVNLLSVGLGDPLCKLKTMRLSACQITEKGFSSLASALRSNPSHLRELDLSHNDLGDSGVELLSAELHRATCNLETLRLSGCLVTERGCASLASALRSDPSHLRELDLSYNHPGDSGAKLLSALLDDPHCSLHTLSVDHGGEIRMKPGLRKYACDLTLDPNTANRTINLSEENRKATCTETEQPYPDHPERFVYCPTVLGREGLSGSRCYWEVEMRGGGNIGVTYRGIERGGYTDNSRVGFYDKSWSVECPGNKYSSYHKGKPTCIPVNPSGSTRVGVYLDWPAGTLSFYRVSSDTLTLIHTFHSSFSEPLYPALTLYYDSSMALR